MFYTTAVVGLTEKGSNMPETKLDQLEMTQTSSTPDQHTYDTLVFLAMKWQDDNAKAGHAIEEREQVIQALEGQLRRAKEDLQYYKDNLQFERETTNQNISSRTLSERLSHAQIMQLLWDIFGPEEKIPAIKHLRQVEGQGLKEAKDIVDKDWAHRTSEGTLDDGGQMDFPVDHEEGE